MKNIYFIGGAVILLNLLLAAIFIPESSAQSGDSQSFTPSRYVITSAPVHVISPHVSTNSNRLQNVMVKMDTVTGKAWMLQLYVTGGAEAKLRQSSWQEIGIKAHRH